MGLAHRVPPRRGQPGGTYRSPIASSSGTAAEPPPPTVIVRRDTPVDPPQPRSAPSLSEAPSAVPVRPTPVSRRNAAFRQDNLPLSDGEWVFPPLSLLKPAP